MASNTCSHSKEDDILTGDEKYGDLGTNKSPGDKQKRKCEYGKGKKHSKYSVQDKANIIELIEKGTKTCDIVRMTGIPESENEVYHKMKCVSDVMACDGEAKDGESDGDTEPYVDSSDLDDVASLIKDYDFPIPKSDADFCGFGVGGESESDKERLVEEGVTREPQ